MMTESLANLARRLDSEHDQLVAKLAASRREIGKAIVSLTCDKGKISVAIIYENCNAVCIPANDFIRMIGWFRQHYGDYLDMLDEPQDIKQPE